MDLGYSFSKSKIPQGMSYPLKRSVLDESLRQIDLTKIHYVEYTIWQKSNKRILWVDYTGEDLRSWAASGRCSIFIFAVPTSQRKEIESALTSEVLPKMIQWLRELESAGNTRRGPGQEFAAYWHDGALSIEKT